MNGTWGVFCAWAPGIPIPAGTWRGDPLTKMVRCAWMWKMVCSLVWHLIPSTSLPVAAAAVLASGGALGTGTPSGPVGPGWPGGWRRPSAASEESFSRGEPPAAGLDEPAAAGLEPPLRVAASVTPTTAAITTAAEMIPTIQLRRRLRRASRARILAIFCRACCLFLLPLDTGTHLSSGHSPKEDRL